MAELEPRYPCPVCLGVKLQKARVGKGDQRLVLDHCRRCGGIWFEIGEVQRLRHHRPQALWDRITTRSQPFRMQCPGCSAMIDRNAEACPGCEWRNTIDCPSCQRPMEAESYGGLRLDVCRSCRGVWFDHVELAHVWNLSLSAALQRRRLEGGRAVATYDGPYLVLDALSYSPGIIVYGARAAGYAVSGAVDVLSSAPQAAGGVIDAVGDAASSVFDVVVEIIGGLFS